MSEPASGVVGTAAVLGLMSLTPWIDANAMMGACLGAGLVAYTKVDTSALKRLGALAFSATLGYLMADEVVSLTFVNQTGAGAFVGSIAIVPLANKFMASIDKFDMNEFIKKWKGS